MRRSGYVFVFSCLFMCAFVGAAGKPASPEVPVVNLPDFRQLIRYRVSRIIDGDTIVVASSQEQGYEQPGAEKRQQHHSAGVTVRLIGVDTPETVHPAKPVQEYGKEASCFTTNLLKGEEVYLAYDGDNPAQDRYGRTLAYVYRAPEGLFVNAEIIRQGYGHAYVKYPFKYLEEFRQLERFARHAEEGLWASQDNKVAPAKPSRSIAPLTTIKPKPDADDVTVHVTRTGRRYHTAGCSSLRKSKIPMRLKNAKAKGYTPCSRCRPPE